MDLASGMIGHCAGRARPGLLANDAEVTDPMMPTVIAGSTSPRPRPDHGVRGRAATAAAILALGGGAWAMDRPVADAGPAPRTAWVAQAPAADPTPGSTANPVEPLSNGLVFSMTSLDVKNRLGDPGRKAGFPSCVLDFGAFVAETCYSAQDRITRLSLRRAGVQLSSGLGVGSSQADVVRVLGQAFGAQLGPYRIEVSYDAGRVSQIRIDHDPAKAAAPPPARALAPAPAQAAAAPGADPVLPLSNGLVFSMTSLEVKNRLGDPGRKAGFPSCVMDYGAFVAETCYSAQDRITRLYLRRPGVQLSSGLGVGSTPADVARVLGQPAGAQLGAYKIEVSYDRGLVTQIKVDHDPAAAAPATDAGTTAADQARNNHYMNLMQLQNRLDQNGTFGHNPARSP